VAHREIAQMMKNPNMHVADFIEVSYFGNELPRQTLTSCSELQIDS